MMVIFITYANHTTLTIISTQGVGAIYAKPQSNVPMNYNDKTAICVLRSTSFCFATNSIVRHTRKDKTNLITSVVKSTHYLQTNQGQLSKH